MTIRTKCYTVVMAYVHVLISLRPIVSFVNSPTYAISGYLARILSPLLGILIMLSKIPANSRISHEIKLLTLVKN